MMMMRPCSRIASALWLTTLMMMAASLSSITLSVEAFSGTTSTTARPTSQSVGALQHHAECSELGDSDNRSGKETTTSADALSSRRRSFLARIAATTALATGITTEPTVAADDSTFKTAVRPLYYRVDSTTPPTLLSMTPRQSQTVLQQLVKGSGTDKQAIVVDTVNLNNMLNKAVFGTANAVQNVVGKSTNDKAKTEDWPASFCCLGINTNNSPTTASSTNPQQQAEDVNLVVQVLQTMAANNKQSSCGLGLYFLPYSTQEALNQFTAGTLSWNDLQPMLLDAGVSMETQQLYKPVFDYAASSQNSNTQWDLIAMAPEVQDIAAVRTSGIPGVDSQRRAQYVVDAAGFIGLTQDPKFKLYTDRSLIKDYGGDNASDSDKNSKSTTNTFQNFFAERILVHEAGATALAQYALKNSNGNGKAFVAALAPVSDVRFLGGINGRLPRVANALWTKQEPESTSTFNDNAVTTILLNPTAAGTLSTTRYLRLEIGTGPETLQYQTKVADYLWFSATPKVNLIPRLMN